MPLFLAADCIVDKLHQFAVRGAAIHQSAQIMVPDRKEASTDLAIGGDPDPAAMPAEGMGDRCNDSDFADPIFESVTPGGFTGFARNLDKADGKMPCVARSRPEEPRYRASRRVPLRAA